MNSRRLKLTTIILLMTPFLFFQNCAEVEFESFNSSLARTFTNCPNNEASCDIIVSEEEDRITKQIVLRHDQPTYRKLDLLIIMDTSGSLDNERKGIAQGISSFLGAKFDDIQVGVMVAAAEDQVSGHLLESNSSSAPLILKSKDFNMSDPVDVEAFQQSVRDRILEADGFMAETPLLALYNAMNKHYDENKAEGFFRDDAALAVLMVSDENDWCSRDFYPAGVNPVKQNSEIFYLENYCRSNDGQPLFSYQDLVNSVVSKQQKNPFILSGIFYQDPQTVPDFNNVDEAGYGLIETVALANGIDPSDFYKKDILKNYAIDLAIENLQDYSPLTQELFDDLVSEKIANEMSLLANFVQKNVDLKNNFVLTLNDDFHLEGATVKVFVDGLPVNYQVIPATGQSDPVLIIKQGEQGAMGSVVVIQYTQVKVMTPVAGI